jgi:hypothetical protein
MPVTPLKPLQAPALLAQDGIRHAYFTREGGVSTGIYASLNGGIGSADVRARVLDNRARMAGYLGVMPDHLLSLWQVHSAEVVTVNGAWDHDARPKADAMVTATPGMALAIATADCGPLLFADAQRGVIGAAHAGWKGAIGGIVEATLAGMEELGALRSAITVAIGPMLSQANYEVGPEFVERFVTEDAGNDRFFRPSRRASHAMFDLPGYVRERLLRAGVAAVDDVALCTYADPQRFFSYRRATHRAEPDYGRLISAIVLPA